MKFKKIAALILSAICIFGSLSLFAFAENDSGSFSMLNYNVAGLPDFGALTEDIYALTVKEKEVIIGNILNESGVDFIAVQEDFNYHKQLISGMTAYEYQTIHSGGVPFGDGMNIYSKTPIYNAERTPWRTTYGVYAEGDRLTPKGILYTVIEIADGVYADFYDIHADAFCTEGSKAARRDNYTQLAEIINSKNNDRPVIITGDFNTSIHLETDAYGDSDASDYSSADIRRIFINQLGMKDAYIELHNDGNYYDFSKCCNPAISYWGNWDSVEKFLYRDGGGIHLEAKEFEYIAYTDENGGIYSDHNAAKVTFTYEKTADYTAADTSSFEVEKPHYIKKFFQNIGFFFKTLFICLANLSEAFELLA